MVGSRKKEDSVKKLLGLLLFLAGPAYAGTDVAVSISSAIPSGLTITTGTAIRADYWNRGNYATSVNYSTMTSVIRDRIGVTIQNLDTANNIYCDYNISVSTIVVNANIGTMIEPGDHVYFGLPAFIPLYCKAVDAAGASGVRTNVKQYARP